MENGFGKFFWDILATIVGLYLGYRVFIFFGEYIPTFGYIIGLVVGLLALGVGAVAVHGVELFFTWILYKLFIKNK